MRLLAFADEPPPVDPVELVAANEPELVLTLGDLERQSIASVSTLDLPRLGVHGNHDEPGELEQLGVENLHLRRAQIGDWTFAGVEGCVRYGGGPHQYTQDEAAELVRGLPPADVLVCHCPPAGINDEPDDPAHVGFTALRSWVENHRPRYLLHGHTTPDPRRRTHRLGTTRVIWIRGAAVVELDPRDTPRPLASAR